MDTQRMTQPIAFEHPRRWRPAAALGVVVLHFSLFGGLSGVKGVMWSELLTALQLSEGTFGTAQLVSPLMATIVLVRYAALVVRVRPKVLAVLGLGLAAAALMLLASVTTMWGLLGSLALLGAGTGLLDGAMNHAAIDWERATRRPVMNFIHACFSSGAVLGALGAGAGLGTGWSYGQVLGALAVVYVGSALATLAIRYPPVDETPTMEEPAAWRPLLHHPPLRALMLICGLSVVVESIIFVWSVIYIRTELDAPVVLGSAAFAVFNGAMFAGRLLNGRLVALRGARTSLIGSGVSLILGTVILVTTDTASLAIGALLVLGLAVAGIFPTVVGEVGTLVPGKSGALTGMLLTTTYVCFLVAPPVIGWVAEWSSLRIALSLVGVCGLSIVWFVWRLHHLPSTVS